MTDETIYTKLQEISELPENEWESEIEKLSEESGKRSDRLKQQLDIIIKKKEEEEDIDKEKKEILFARKKKDDLARMKEDSINWIDDDYYDSWKKVRRYTKTLLNDGKEWEGTDEIKWFFLSHSNDSIIGRPQLIESVQKRIPIIRCAVKKEKALGSNIMVDKQRFFFFDDKFDKRYDGRQVDAFSLDFLMYKVVTPDNKEYYLLSQEELPNQVCTFKGMSVELDDFAEMSRSMKIRSLSRLFFVKDWDPTIKTLSPEQIVTYTQSRNITEQDWLDFLNYHELGTRNVFPDEANILRSAFLLSSRVDEIPMHIGIMGPAGSRKSMGYIETIAYKFSETPNIVEGANSRLKGLTPSFAVKPANLGYLAKCERIGWIDELGKMVEAEANKHQSNTKNILGELNALLDNKVREVNSGNDNTCSVQATAKFTFVMNPISGKKTLGYHVGLMDPTTMSRILWWVQDKDEQELVMSENGVERVEKVPPTPSQDQATHGFTHKLVVGLGKKTKKSIVLGKCWGKIDNREEFLSLFDSCNDFLSVISDEKINKLTNTITMLAREPMKSVWKPRGEHHVKLLVDGIVKQRCLFRDYDTSFEAKDEDYDLAERVLIRMVKGWDTDLGTKREDTLNI